MAEPAEVEGLTEDEVYDAVSDTLAGLPEWIRDRLGDVAVLVEETDPLGGMGIYDNVGGMQRIVIFRDANPNVEEVRKTVLHEIGHHFGMDERQIEELGYA